MNSIDSTQPAPMARGAQLLLTPLLLATPPAAPKRPPTSRSTGPQCPRCAGPMGEHDQLAACVVCGFVLRPTDFRRRPLKRRRRKLRSVA